MDTITRTKKPENAHLELTKRTFAPINIKLEQYTAASRYGYTSKRFFDVTISSLLVLGLLSWLFPILCLLIKLSSRGPILFIQKRVGFKNQVFNCIKFRTMYVNDEADIQEAIQGDKRITRLGKILRKTYLDELPQLINVLKGEMSLVGPRPHMLYHHRKFSAMIPDYRTRHWVKPGITGLAQVKGYHGPFSDESTINGRTRLDLFYVKKASIGLDIKIFLKTLSIILSFRFFK